MSTLTCYNYRNTACLAAVFKFNKRIYLCSMGRGCGSVEECLHNILGSVPSISSKMDQIVDDMKELEALETGSRETTGMACL